MTARPSCLTFALPQNRHGRPPRDPLRHKLATVTEQRGSLTKRTSTESEGPEDRMPPPTDSPLPANLSSFMSVFGDGSVPQTTEQKSAEVEKKQLPAATQSSYLRRDSTSTFESTDSSPTTTISTVASSLTEPSPSSSPESPPSFPNSSFKGSNSSLVQTHQGMEKREHFANSFPMLPGVGRQESSNKKMRNMKNLSVNTSKRPSTSHLPKLGSTDAAAPIQPSHASSAPPTPAFIVPSKPPRRKPSNLGLTLMTPDSGSSNQQDRPNIVPPTPSDDQIHTLMQLQSSSTSTGPLFSPTLAPEGGMRLPPLGGSLSGFGAKAGPQLSISPSVLTSPIKKQTLEHVQEEPDYEAPLSREVKSPAYPQGPVCIYDPLVYLYLEPTRIEAQEFDVVINVAREVQNPFEKPEEAVAERKTADKGVQVCFDNVDKGVQASFDIYGRDLAGPGAVQEPSSGAPELGFRSAFEMQVDDDSTTEPSTPKATKYMPEYIHIPWDHNTNVVDDLPRLCELIDDRVRQGKRVLIHCQCGVSRSASLVVAYGLYKNQQITVQEAYDTVKGRSKWIGPNMNLIYQLAEFKGKLATTTAPGTQAWHSWRASGADRPNMRRSLSPEILVHPDESENDVIIGWPRLSSSVPKQSKFAPFSAKLAATPRAAEVAPAPLSAPPKYRSAQGDENSDIFALGNQPSDSLRPRNASVSNLMDVDTENSLTPMVGHQEAVQEKEPAPAGAIAHDLREVARDLDQRGTVGSSMSTSMDIDAEEEYKSPSGSRSNELTAKESISDLPIGFSSLLSRRQRLPLRQSPSPFTASPINILRPINPTSHHDVPKTPSLLSPRAAEFTASPFHRTQAGDLAGSSVFEQGLMTPTTVQEDPRSPAQKGEAPITRNIFDMI